MWAGAMLTLGVNVASTAGPLLAGWVAGHLGLPAVFSLNAASFAGVIVVLARHARDPATSHSPSGASPWAAMLEGLAVVRGDVRLRSALLSYGALLVFGPSPSFILPLFGQKILGIHQGQLGALFAVVGVGTHHSRGTRGRRLQGRRKGGPFLHRRSDRLGCSTRGVRLE